MVGHRVSWLYLYAKPVLKSIGGALFRYKTDLHAKIYPLEVAENMARELFAFGAGSEKITRHNEKIPTPLLGKTQTAILAFLVRVFE